MLLIIKQHYEYFTFFIMFIYLMGTNIFRIVFDCIKYWLFNTYFVFPKKFLASFKQLFHPSANDLQTSLPCIRWRTPPYLYIIAWMSTYWELVNLLVKLHLSAPSVLHVLSNFWNAFLPIVFTASPKPKICSADSKLDFVKVGAAKIRLLG